MKKNIVFNRINESHLESMSNLLLDRQKAIIDSFDFLKNDSNNFDRIRESLDEKLKKGIEGIVALRNKRVVGFIFGVIRNDYFYNRSIWVPYDGMAISTDEDTLLLNLLYKEASRLWVKNGYFSHYVMVPLGDERYFKGFLNLSFAIQQVHCVLRISEYEGFGADNSLAIRDLNKNDKNELRKMADIIMSYQNRSPIYVPAIPEMLRDIRNGYGEIIDDSDLAAFRVGEVNSDILSFQAFWDVKGTLMNPKNAVELKIAGTYQRYMGQGYGKELMNDSIDLLKGKNYEFIVADYRVSNLASSEFWRKCGFKPIAYRMVREIDNRISWAKFFEE